MKRSITNFDRTVATKMFDKTNRQLKDSHISRLTQSGFITKSHSLNREFNMSLKIVRNWVNDQNLNSVESYQKFCQLANKKNQVLN
jgi:hypothetical protein